MDEKRRPFLDKGYAISKPRISKQKMAQKVKKYYEKHVTEEREPFDPQDIFQRGHPVDKEKQAKYGSRFFEDDTSETENMCRQVFEDWFADRKGVRADKQLIGKESRQPLTELTRSGNREQDMDSLVKILKRKCSLISVASKKLFVFNGKINEDISERRQAVTYFKKILAEETNRLFKDYSEIHNQLLCDPDIAIDSLEELPTNRDVIVFQNGTYNVREGTFYRGQFWADDYIFSMLAIEYDETDFSGQAVIDGFLNTFCAGMEDRIRLFCEILGFCLSNYENKKACFYFLGAPDAGKSTVCRFIEQVIGENLYMACSIQELTSKYTTGELVGIKVCADEDVATNKPLKSDDVELIKKITSSDKIRTRQIYQKAVQLRPDCKLVLAGNGMLTFATSEDLQPLINRLIIFPLDVSIPKEERDPDILSKLLAGRNYMITLALNALHDLVENRFCFSEVVDTASYFNSQIYTSGVEDFVESECELAEDAVSFTRELYNSYRHFCEKSLSYQILSVNQFIPYLKTKYGVDSYSDGAKRGVRGVRLLDVPADNNNNDVD